MPAARTTLALVALAAVGAAAPGALAVRAPTSSQAKAIRAALTPAVQQSLCAEALIAPEKCAASVLTIQQIRIATDNPKYAWVKLAVASGPGREDWFAQDGNVWKRTGAKWRPIKGGGCSFPVTRRLPKPVQIDFGAEYCGIAPPGVREG